MSRIIERDVPCPFCGNTQKFPFYEIVNSTENPELKQKVMDGSIFDMNCSVCHESSRIGYPMLYHDAARQAMIVMTDQHNEEAILGMAAFLSKSGLIPAEACSMLRAVHQPPELSEKLIILDHDLDDRVIEIMKLSVRAIFMAANHDQDPARVQLVETDDGLFILVMMTEDDMPTLTPFNMDQYMDTEEAYAAFFTNDREADLFVNREWVLSMLTPSDVLH